MVDDVVSRTCRSCDQRAAAAGDAVCLAGTGNAGPESQVCSELRRVGEP